MTLKGKTVQSVFNAEWYIEPRTEFEVPCSMLTFEHPTHGAVSFLIPADQVKTMVELMSKQLELFKAIETKSKETIQ